jgi:hypothetical protein
MELMELGWFVVGRQNLNALGLFRNATVRVEVTPHNEVHNGVRSCAQTVPAGPNDGYPNPLRIRDSEQGERGGNGFVNRRSRVRIPPPAQVIPGMALIRSASPQIPLEEQRSTNP